MKYLEKIEAVITKPNKAIKVRSINHPKRVEPSAPAPAYSVNLPSLNVSSLQQLLPFLLASAEQHGIDPKNYDEKAWLPFIRDVTPTAILTLLIYAKFLKRGDKARVLNHLKNKLKQRIR